MYKIKVTVVITIFNASVNVEDARAKRVTTRRWRRRPKQGCGGGGIFFHVHCMLHNCRSIDLLTFRIDYHMGRSAKEAAAALFHLYRGVVVDVVVVLAGGGGARFLDQTSSLISSSDA